MYAQWVDVGNVYIYERNYAAPQMGVWQYRSSAGAGRGLGGEEG